MKHAADALRTEGTELLARAGQVGSLSRAIQQQRLRLATEIEKVALLEAEVNRLNSERDGLVGRIAGLEERLGRGPSTGG